MAINIRVGNEPEEVVETEPEDLDVNNDGKINVLVGDAARAADGVIDVKVTKKEKPEPPPVKIKLNIRKALDGRLIISSHPDVDIVIEPRASRIIVFPREKKTDKVYDVQDRFFSYLANKGIVRRSEIQSGSAFGSMQGLYPPQKEKDTFSFLQAILLNISKFIEEESEYFDIDEKFEEEFEDSLTDPDADESTELGEIPHADQKGSIRPGYIYSPYGISSIYRYE